MVKNPAANARDTGLIPGQRKAHTHRVTEPVCHSDRAHTPWSLFSATRESPSERSLYTTREQPRLATTREAALSKESQHSQKEISK